MAHFDEIVTVPGLTRQRIETFLEKSRDPADLMDGRYVIVHSSGTSGQLAYCAYTLREWIQGYTSFFRAVPVFGPIPRRTAFFGAAGGHFTAVTLAQTIHWTKLGVFHRSRVFDVNEPWRDVIEGLNEFQPHNLTCYGSLLGELCTEQERKGLNIRPRTVICGGDPLPPRDRLRAEHLFGARVIDVYATTETLVVGMAEPKSQGMVLLEDDLWIEVQDDQLLVTNLRNRTTPLIRYAHSDAVVPSAFHDDHAYYRGFRRIEAITGRCEDKLVLLNQSGQEDFIHPLLIVEFYIRGMERFQLVRTGPAAFTFRVKPRAGLSSEELNRVARDIRIKWDTILAQKNMRNVRYQLEWTEDLRHDPRTGKFRLVETTPTTRPTIPSIAGHRAA
jgi:phenylacetate-CoA ligase